MAFEEADQQLEQSLEKENSSAVEAKDTEATNTQQSPVELDKLEKVLYGGKEYSQQQLKEHFMRQEDYSRKTQEIAQERKYVDNLAIDLAAVRKSPELAARFMEIYPKQYHALVEQFKTEQPQAQKVEEKYQSDPAMLNRLEQIEQHYFQAEVEKAQAQLDNIMTDLQKKYEMADERVVLSTAEHLRKQGVELDKSTFEKIYKDDHQRNQDRYKSFYKSQVDQQKKASKDARDVANGGGVPGQAPKKETFDEATQRAIREVSARN